MHSSVLFTLASGLALVHAQAPTPVPGVTGKLGNARIVENNPAGVSYVATLPESDTTDIRGSVVGTSNSNGTGVNFQISLSGLPDASLGPFLYHIHDQPVPSDGNCTGTKAHLDSYIRGEKPPCYPVDPASCQDGDLAGKHGNITGSSFSTAFLDLYLSTAKGPQSFFGNRSIVIHTSNTTRLTCANFTLATGNATSGGNSSSNTTSPVSPTLTPFTGGAATTLISAGAILAGMAAFLL
ncbi:hypothetical protein G7Y79_00037g073100 [Physcia stellaris]|nr:hypothetical protein G7Y79_00037g073100 [Physcia stellaris]